LHVYLSGKVLWTKKELALVYLQHYYSDTFRPNFGYLWNLWLSYGTGKCYVGHMWPSGPELGLTWVMCHKQILQACSDVCNNKGCKGQVWSKGPKNIQICTTSGRYGAEFSQPHWPWVNESIQGQMWALFGPNAFCYCDIFCFRPGKREQIPDLQLVFF